MSDFIAQFQFLRPWCLLGLLLLPLILWRLQQQQAGFSAWQNIIDAHLLTYLQVKSGGRQRRLNSIIVALGWLIAVLALAGPSWSQQTLPVFSNQAARIIVLDVSLSMQANDLKPSRLQRAKFKINDLLALSEDAQIGLVVYAGAAFTVTPLTSDTETIRHLLPVLDPSIMPRQGSRLDLALYKALQLLQQAQVRQGQVIVFSDAVSPAISSAALSASRDLVAAAYSVSVIGVGTLDGAPVPGADGQLLTDSAGAIVLSQLDETALRALAQSGQGQYQRLRVDGGDLDAILLDSTATSADNQEQVSSLPIDQGPWLLLCLLPLIWLSFRPGYLFALILFIPFPHPAQAFDWPLGWNDLWLRSDQQAAKALQAQQYQQALSVAEQPWQRGQAAYRIGNYEQALTEFSRQPGAIGHYNRGNALAQLGRYQEALAAYEAALQEQADFPAAEANRKLMEELIKQQRQEQSENADQTEQEQNNQQGSGEQSNNQSQQQSAQQSAAQQSAAQQENNGQQNGNQENAGQQNAEQQAQTDEQADKLTEESAEQPETDSQQEETPASSQPTAQLTEQPPNTEEQQMLEQWLRRIPDDPGGLLRRKFLYQYQRREERSDIVDNPW